MSFVSKRTLSKTVVLMLFTAALLYSFSSSPPAGYTGGFGEPNCTDCHGSFLIDSGRDLGGTFDILGVPAEYTPGATYPITVRIAQLDKTRWGFQLAVRFEESRAQAGQIVVTDAVRTQVQPFLNVQYISHTFLGTSTGIVDGPVSWTFNWQAPAAPGGVVLFHANGNAANGNGSTGGDHIYTDVKASRPAGGGGGRNEPYSVIMADLNVDDIPDVIRVNYGSNNISILLGLGDGSSFVHVPDVSVGRQPWMATVSLLNDDGIPDVITANGQSNNISVLIGQGDGTFAPATYSVGAVNPRSVATADLDVDNWPDLVTANYDSNNVSVLMNQRDGTFSSAMNFATEATPHFVSAGDLDNDGYADLVVSNYTAGTLSVLRGVGDGTFAAAVNYPAGGVRPNTSVLADFNGDGNLDVAVVNQGSNNLSVLLGNGMGVLGAAATTAVGGGPLGLAAGDLNNDGRLDLVTANSNSDTIRILLGNGMGGFTAQPLIPVGDFPRAVAVGILDLFDTELDIVVANTNDHSLSILFGNGQGGVY